MDITATNDFKNQSYEGIKKHVQHDPKLNHSNKDIKPEFTQYNHSEILLDYQTMDKIKEDMFLDDMIEYNQKQIRSRHKKNVKKDINDYIKMKTQKKNWDKCLVSTFGNKQDQDELLSGLDDDGIAYALKKQSHALSEFARDFNNRNKYLKIERFTTNVDESTPHLHAQIIPLGHTKKGKASLSLDSALSAEYKNKTGHELKDSRQILSWFRNTEDNALTSYMSKEFINDLDEKYQLKRTGEHVDNFDSYKKVKAALDKQKESLEREKNMFIMETHGDQIYNRRLKKHTLGMLKTINPKHKTEVNDAQPINTDEGMQQHENKSLTYLFDYIFESLKRTFQESVQFIRNFKSNFQKFTKEIIKINNHFREVPLPDDDVNKLSKFSNKPVQVKSMKQKIKPIDFVINEIRMTFNSINKANNKNIELRQRLEQRSNNLDKREQDLNEREQEINQRKLDMNGINKEKDSLTIDDIDNNEKKIQKAYNQKRSMKHNGPHLHL